MADGANRRHRAATIIDVAREAGVSFKTVSRVLNHETNVRPQTKARVLEAVKALDYVTNQNARNLRARESRLIGLFFAVPSRDYLGEILWGTMQKCQEEGYNLVSEDCGDAAKPVLALRGDTHLAGAIVASPLSYNQEFLKALTDQNVPYVRIAADKMTDDSDTVGMDYLGASFEMTEYLIGLGHRRIAFIKGPVGHLHAGRRLDGYLKALEAHGIVRDDNLIASGAYTFASGLAASEALMAQGADPTAIFAGNDDMAAGALSWAYRNKISVPDDLSIVGFDDNSLASTMSPALTTIRQPSEDMASKAVELLIARLQGEREEPAHVIEEYKLVVRESSAPPPKR